MSVCLGVACPLYECEHDTMRLCGAYPGLFVEVWDRQAPSQDGGYVTTLSSGDLTQVETGGSFSGSEFALFGTPVNTSMSNLLRGSDHLHGSSGGTNSTLDSHSPSPETSLLGHKSAATFSIAGESDASHNSAPQGDGEGLLQEDYTEYNAHLGDTLGPRRRPRIKKRRADGGKRKRHRWSLYDRTGSLSSPSEDLPNSPAKAWDVYMCGCVLYYMVEGKHPFDDILDGRFSRLSGKTNSAFRRTGESFRHSGAARPSGGGGGGGGDPFAEPGAATGEYAPVGTDDTGLEMQYEEFVDHIHSAVVRGKRPRIRKSVHQNVREVIESMWHQNPIRRPQLPRVLQVINHSSFAGQKAM